MQTHSSHFFTSKTLIQCQFCGKCTCTCTKRCIIRFDRFIRNQLEHADMWWKWRHALQDNMENITACATLLPINKTLQPLPLGHILNCPVQRKATSWTLELNSYTRTHEKKFFFTETKVMIYVAYSNISAKQVPVATKMYRWEKNHNFNGFQSRYCVCLLSICQSYSFDITAHMAKCALQTFDALVQLTWSRILIAVQPHPDLPGGEDGQTTHLQTAHWGTAWQSGVKE